VQFSADNHDWPLSTSERTRLIDAALEDDQALARFVANADRVLGHALTRFSDGGSHTSYDVASYVGLIGGLVMNGRLKDAQARRAGWNMLCGAASLAAAMIPGAIVGAAATAAVMIVQSEAGPDVGSARQNEVYRRDLEMTLMGEAQLRASDQQLRANGTIPATTPLPPKVDPHPRDILASIQFLRDFQDYLDTLPGGIDGPAGTRIQSRVLIYVNPYTSGADLAAYVVAG
jgi:hypothetical protein